MNGVPLADGHWFIGAAAVAPAGRPWLPFGHSRRRRDRSRSTEAAG